MNLKSCAVLFLLVGSTSATAQDNCAVVLNSGAFDRSSGTTTTFIMQSQRDSLCDKSYTSIEEAQQAAKSSGFSLGYKKLSIGQSRARQTSNGRWEIRDTEFCRASLADFQSSFGSTYEQQAASIAVRAWEECVKSTQSNQLFLTYELEAENNLLSGRLVRTATDNAAFEFSVTGVGVTGEAAGNVRCRVGTRQFDPLSLETATYRVTETSTVFSCEKLGPGLGKHATLSIQTSQGAIPHVSMPSQRARDEDRIDLVNNKLQQLQLQVARETVPVGTIVASLLNYEEFLTVNAGDRTDWVPADGRRVPGTRYADHQERVPDLRGLFLRGSNSMGEDPSLDPLPAQRANPEPRAVGEFQNDMFAAHNHRGHYDSFNPRGIGSKAYATVSSRNKTDSAEWSVKSEGGAETRPRNMTVVYYIKVN